MSDVRGADVPRPAPGPGEAPFWDALRAGELHIQQCTDCEALRHPPKPVCARCGAREHTWARSAGVGEVWSFTIIHPPVLPAFADRVPYNAIVVRLDEGLFLVSNLVDCDAEEISVGLRVELAPHVVDDDLTLPLFRRATPRRADH